MTQFENTLPPDPLVGSQLGDTYRILRKIGEGGMAAVYEAQHARVDRRFAIKILHMKVAKSPESLARFDREARIGSQLGHDHIVQVFDFNRTEEGSPYLVMELLEGEELSVVLKREDGVPVEWAVAVVRQVGMALSAAHEHGVVHRDLKPDNIFLCGSPRQHVKSKILDFGLVKVKESKSIVTGDSAVFGTPWYMSPEQARGNVEQIDHRTDIYAMGVVLYRMLSGQLPFDGPSIPSILYRIVHEPPEPLGNRRREAPVGVCAVVERAMHKNADERPQSATEFLTDLEAAMGERWNTVLSWCQRPTDRSQRVHWRVAEPSEPGAPEAFAPTLQEHSDTTAAPTDGPLSPVPSDTRPPPDMVSEQPATSDDHAPSAGRRFSLTLVVAVGVVLISVVLLMLLRQQQPTAMVNDLGVGPAGMTRAVPDLSGPDSTSSRPSDLTSSVGRTISVFTQPSGAELSVDGVAFGETPIEKRPISTDRVRVVASLKGYITVRRSLLEGAKPVVLNLTLRPRPATLNVACLVGGNRATGDIYVDGRKVDQTPAMVRNLGPGRHRIRVQVPGFAPKVKTVQLVAGSHRTLVFRFGK